MTDVAKLAPFFLGAYGENHQHFEQAWLEFFRDHVYWRRNFHPQDVPPVSAVEQYQPQYLASIARTKEALHQLSAELKQSVPISNPRYVGHMCSELLMPSVLAQMITTLYNPNNVALEVAPVTVKQELQVGIQLATMFGFATDPSQAVCGWGHLTSGGTIANYESLWLFRAVKYYPLAVYLAAQQEDKLDFCWQGQAVTQYSPWQLFNLSIDQVIAFNDQLIATLKDYQQTEQKYLLAIVAAHRIESLGPVDFYQALPGLKQPVVLVPITAHYSWQKAMKILGMGSKQLRYVQVDEHMRLDPADLRAQLAALAASQTPILATVGVLGTTEYGTVDPIDQLVAARQEQSELNYYIHVDAAWGGYVSALFRNADGSLRSQTEVASEFDQFPSDNVYKGFAALGDVDSITVDPHKLGYIPYGCGAIITRNRRVVEFISQEAPYVFDDTGVQPPLDERLMNLGQFIMEGSKPGAMAAAAYVSHQVLPLHSEEFGRLPAKTVQLAERFHQLVREFAKRVQNKVTIVLPMDTDTNLTCVAFNPVGNRDMAELNRYTRQLFEHVKVKPERLATSREFIASYTSIQRKNLTDKVANKLCTQLGIDPTTYTESLFVFRHTLMNPWLGEESGKCDYLAKYLEFLAELIEQS
ncbi:pyridoxal phosphate-dependent decarboxylase family protein [Salinibius halmophilus]|uniref:pyridoxal phosphate-dependent decarboxylase family protein n=1 Tax=Salinibius halmophilus TaxID=1853216 RepID=UPI000E66F98B|nr:pyridoxal-dependent decarboxylase [Salinibius halmophilus]